jgi:hypothetical protein
LLPATRASGGIVQRGPCTTQGESAWGLRFFGAPGTQRDAAAVLDLPEGTVKSRLIAAKRELVALAERLLPPSQRDAP